MSGNSKHLSNNASNLSLFLSLSLSLSLSLPLSAKKANRRKDVMSGKRRSAFFVLFFFLVEYCAVRTHYSSSPFLWSPLFPFPSSFPACVCVCAREWRRRLFPPPPSPSASWKRESRRPETVLVVEAAAEWIAIPAVSKEMGVEGGES